MEEPTHSDVWLCRLEGEESSRLRAASAMFRVDVRGAKQILSQLPRLVARDLPSAEARKLSARLRTVGGVVHVCGSGQKPDFDALNAATVSPTVDATPAARTEAKRSPAERPSAERATPERVTAERGATERAAHERAPLERAVERGNAERVTAPSASANESAAHAARAAQDAALALWPEDGTPCTWEISESSPPPLPRPTRHSAARVAWTLVTVLTIVGGAAGAFWASFGKDVLAVSIAEAHVVPQHRREPPASAAAAPGSRFALAQALAGATSGDAFRALVTRVQSALDREPEPLRIENQVVGASFELREPAVQSQLEELYPEVHAAGATLLRHVKGSRVGIDRLALVPTTDTSTIVRVLGTSSPALDNEAVVAWLGALHAARPLRLLGAGENFVEGRYDVPMPDGAQLEGDVYTCPGMPVRPKGTGDLAGALESIRKGERFSCQW